jgi:hypothetical protein
VSRYFVFSKDIVSVWSGLVGLSGNHIPSHFGIIGALTIALSMIICQMSDPDIGSK